MEIIGYSMAKYQEMFPGFSSYGCLIVSERLYGEKSIESALTAVGA